MMRHTPVCSARSARPGIRIAARGSADRFAVRRVDVGSDNIVGDGAGSTRTDRYVAHDDDGDSAFGDDIGPGEVRAIARHGGVPPGSRRGDDVRTIRPCAAGRPSSRDDAEVRARAFGRGRPGVPASWPSVCAWRRFCVASWQRAVAWRHRAVHSRLVIACRGVRRRAVDRLGARDVSASDAGWADVCAHRRAGRFPGEPDDDFFACGVYRTGC